jgi:hypothetical protein
MNIPSDNGRILYSYGFVKFEDIFGNINEVGFCWRYMPDVRRFYPEDNDAYSYHYVYRPPPIRNGRDHEGLK